MEYGLIGEKLGHSYSKIIHEMLFDYSYILCPLAPDQLEDFIKQKQWKAINVTIPYKEKVIPFLDCIDPVALEIGSVNTIVKKENQLYGYNTDFLGFSYMLEVHGVSLKDKKVLILGTGGTQKPVLAVCKAQGAKQVLLVSRTPKGEEISYEQIKNYPDIDIIVNTTPIGMYPHNGECLINMDWFANCKAVFDVIYNPFCTELLLNARQAGILAVDGFSMLVAQAAYAAEKFLQTSVSIQQIQKVEKTLRKQLTNLVLIGMPSCGKTAMGREVAKLYNKKFVDLDEEIEKQAEMPIPAIFDRFGEDTFRTLETQVCKKFGAENGMVLSTGGGVVKKAENIKALKQNGIVVFLDRPLDKLLVGGNRPLSKSPQALKQMYKERYPLYQDMADIVVQNQGEIQSVVQQIRERFDEIFGD